MERIPTEPSGPSFDEAKFRELILYIAERTSSEADFGDVKLNKALAFSDFLAYVQLGQPITGAEYQRQNFGPVARLLLPIREAMEAVGDVHVEGGIEKYDPRRTIADREPNTSAFTRGELALVDEVLSVLRGRTATEASELSHRVMAGWKVAETGETIPYETFLVTARPPSAATLARAREIAEQYANPR